MNESEKDLFILMNEFEQESHKRASQNRAWWPFELIKLKIHLLRPLFIVCNRLKPFDQLAVCTETVYGEKCWNVFIKNLNFFSTEERMTWTSWMTW